ARGEYGWDGRRAGLGPRKWRWVCRRALRRNRWRRERGFISERQKPLTALRQCGAGPLEPDLDNATAVHFHGLGGRQPERPERRRGEGAVLAAQRPVLDAQA